MKTSETAESVTDPFEFELFMEHPSWQPLSRVFNTTNPFFESFLFLLGYEYSSNICLVTGEAQALVDAGNDYTAFLTLFRDHQIKAPIQRVVLTHGHRDHVMGIFELFRAYPGALAGDGYEIIFHEAGPSELKEMLAELGCTTTLVKGGETLKLGSSEWEVIYTPGHTIDGISLYDRSSKTLFSGDVVIPQALAEADKNAGGRLDHYLYSIKTIMDLEVEHLVPGHGPPVSGPLARQVIEKTYERVLVEILGLKGKVAWLDGAKGLARRGLLEEALFCCERQLMVNPDDMEAMQMRAFCLSDVGRFEEALEALGAIEAKCGKEVRDPAIWLGKGYALMGLERYSEGIQLFDRILKIQPDLKEAQIYKGMALYLSGRVDEALDIEAFQSEFAERFKEAVVKQKQG